MKIRITILLSMLSICALAQFPAPSHFEFNYEYIMIDDAGYCNGQWILGPAYCSHFSWSEPDTSATSSTLDHYNLYFNEYGPDTTLHLFAAVSDTFYNVEAGFIGEMWVTAAYTNPGGESEPSNIVINTDLPISVEENLPVKEPAVIYEMIPDVIRIANVDDIRKINFYDGRGRLIKSTLPVSDRIYTGDFQHGLYIVEVFTWNQEKIRMKFIK